MATALASIPAPGIIEHKKAERKAAFIRETAARIVVADAEHDRSTCLDQAVDVAEILAKILSERGYL